MSPAMDEQLVSPLQQHGGGNMHSPTRGAGSSGWNESSSRLGRARPPALPSGETSTISFPYLFFLPRERASIRVRQAEPTPAPSFVPGKRFGLPLCIETNIQKFPTAWESLPQEQRGLAGPVGGWLAPKEGKAKRNETNDRLCLLPPPRFPPFLSALPLRYWP